MSLSLNIGQDIALNDKAVNGSFLCELHCCSKTKQINEPTSAPNVFLLKIVQHVHTLSNTKAEPLKTTIYVVTRL